jgi:ADP-ribose pyrophosphatase YjhB (NUDIX family)
MKTIIRICNVLDTPEAVAAKKFSAFGIRALVEGYAKLRDEFPEAVLIVEHDEDRRPVYITLGPNPPELLAGDRQVHAVFAPPDSQEPFATFAVKETANEWAEAQEGDPAFDDGFEIRAINSTDRLDVQPSVAVMIRRGGDLLFCRLKRSKMWTFPEGRLEVGETIEAAARRAVRNMVGLELGPLFIPGNVPYVNTFIEPAAQHFLTCILVGDYVEGSAPAVADPMGVIDHCEWYPATDPPTPLFHTVQGLVRLLEARNRPVYVGVPDGSIEVFDEVVGRRAKKNVSKPDPLEEPELTWEELAEKDRKWQRERDLMREAKDYVEDAIKSRPPFLITGTPRSGTQYATEVLKKALAEHETDVCHEAVGAIATVSWCHVNPSTLRRYWDQKAGDRTGQYVYDCPKWLDIVHQTRHPLKVIASMPTIAEAFTKNGGWDAAQSALVAQQQRIVGYAGDEVEWPEDLTSIAAYAAFVWRWNRYVETVATFRYRVEDLHGGEGSVWPALLAHLGLDPIPFPKGQLFRDSRPHEIVTWDDVQREAPEYYEPLREMAAEYGYDD